MPTVAYITNQFPSPVEWYVVQEIQELRRRGVRVIPCSSRRVDHSTLPADLRELASETLYLEPLRWRILVRVFLVSLLSFPNAGEWIVRALLESSEPATRRVRALLHTGLGIYYGLLLRDRRVDHIHVHHGYFSSWIGMVAARMLGIPFSMTLHGSDLLTQGTYMKTKLRECRFCFTVSEFNRRHILAHYPDIDSNKIVVQRLGVEIPAMFWGNRGRQPLANRPPVLLVVGRLHPVKNHVFLLRACALLRERGMQFRCVLIGEGPERAKLECLIREWKIAETVKLIGYVPHDEIAEYYELADLVVLTSHSEGIPLVLMEAMALGKLVLAPAITGIPELVADGQTGFLYPVGNLEQFAWQAEKICGSLELLEPVGRAAREHVLLNFDQGKNLARFAEAFVRRIAHSNRSNGNENFVLQQI